MRVMVSIVVATLMAMNVANAEESETDRKTTKQVESILFEGGDGPNAAASVLVYFGQVEGRGDQHLVLVDLIERIGKSDDARYVPALEVILNRGGVYDRQTAYMDEESTHTRQSKFARFHLAQPATNAWLKIMWPRMEEEARVEAILNTIQPDPDVRLVMSEGVYTRAREIKRTLRDPFYENLFDLGGKYDWRSLWAGQSLGAATNLINIMPPTPAQRKELLSGKSVFARYAYLATGRLKEKDEVDLYLKLVNETEGKHAIFSNIVAYGTRMQSRKPQVKDRIRQTLLKHGDNLLEDFRRNEINAWSTTALFSLETVLERFGYHPKTLEFLRRVREVFKNYEVKEAPLPDAWKDNLAASIKGGMDGVKFMIDKWGNKKQDNGK